MEHKRLVIYSILSVVILTFIFYLAPNISLDANSQSDSLNYRGDVCVYLNGELVECSHNVLYNSGANLTRDSLGIGGNGEVLNLSLCNATAGCGTPVAAASETYNEYTGCGLGNVQGAYTSLGQTGNWTVSNTFTASCDNLEVNVTRLQNESGVNFAGNSFTLVTMQTNDQLTINWTLQVS
jgi:hypothetical protein